MLFPDFTNEIEEIISEEDKAIARLTFRAERSVGEIFGIAPTERPIQYTGAAALRFRGDKKR